MARHWRSPSSTTCRTRPSRTEQQFLGLLSNAAREIELSGVHVSRYWLPGIQRLHRHQRRLDKDYRPIEDIYRGRPDGLVVTGTEPLTDDLRT